MHLSCAVEVINFTTGCNLKTHFRLYSGGRVHVFTRVYDNYRANVNKTRTLQPVATCHQSPYVHKPAIVKLLL